MRGVKYAVREDCQNKNQYASDKADRRRYERTSIAFSDKQPLIT